MATNHPGLQASSARLRAAQHGTNAVRTWADPTVKFGGVTASSRGPDLGEDGDLLYGLEQKLPLFGKARAARSLAQAEAGVESARQTYQFQTLRRDLAKGLFFRSLARIAPSNSALRMWLGSRVWLASWRSSIGPGRPSRSTCSVYKMSGRVGPNSSAPTARGAIMNG